MRQVGIFAAAGLVALYEMVDRLAEDRADARILMEGRTDIQGLSVDIDGVQTNMVYLDIEDSTIGPATFLGQCRRKGLNFGQIDTRSFRMVTHYGIEKADIDVTLLILQEVMNSPEA